MLQPTVLSSDPRLQQAADKANTMIGADITLTMAKSVAAEVDATLISQWVVLDENLDATLDRDAMTSWVDELGDQCDTVGSTRTYTRVDGKVCTVSGGTYGWEIDHDGLMDLVTDGVDNGLVETVEVPYVRSCEVYNGVGGRDWGNRYIDVDLTEQHAYMYDDSGKVVWESGVVTGIPDEKKSTPEGVYVINLKKTDETLHTLQDDGVTYKDTVVKYWMPFVGNTVGLHDAWCSLIRRSKIPSLRQRVWQPRVRESAKRQGCRAVRPCAARGCGGCAPIGVAASASLRGRSRLFVAVALAHGATPR